MVRKPAPAGRKSENLSIEQALGRAQAHWEAGQTDQAQLFCQRVLAVWPGHPDALHLLGLMAHAYGDLALAIQNLRQACQSPRIPPRYLSNFAEMCRQGGLLDEAEQAARRAVALDPGMIDAWNNLGIILQEAGKLEESATCLERVTRLNPGWPQGANNLANTYTRMGVLDRAENMYRRAVALAPDYAEAYSNLSLVLKEQGRLDEARTAAQQALSLNPQQVDIYINLAGIERAANRTAEAVRRLDQGLAFAPLHPALLVTRAKILNDEMDFAGGLDHARKVLAAAPTHPGALAEMGRALQGLNRFDDALACFAKAEALPGPDGFEAGRYKAVLLAELGRNAEALAVYDALLAKAPHQAALWFNRTELKTFSPDDPDIEAMRAVLNSPATQSLHNRQMMHFALAKAGLDAGMDDQAFRHLAQGNRLVRDTIRFDAEATRSWMELFPQVFTAEAVNRSVRGGQPSPRPVFVVGMMRSGTTLVEQILAAHPQIDGLGERLEIQRLVDRIDTYPQGVTALSDEDKAALGGLYLEQTKPFLSEQARYSIDKMPSNFLHIGLIRQILPEARIIHCRRDPVDTCLSCYTKLFSSHHPFAYDLEELGRFYLCYLRLMDHWRAILPAGHFIEVDYEAVVADLEGQARRLTSFLDLPWDEACLRFHLNKGAVRTASAAQVRKPIFASSAGRWRRYEAYLEPLLRVLKDEADVRR